MDKILFENVKKYIDENLVVIEACSSIKFSLALDFDECESIDCASNSNKDIICPETKTIEKAAKHSIPIDINLDKTFGEKLIEEIDKKGLKDSYVYKSAYVSRQLFNNIKNKKGYNPSKDIAIALIFPLELSYEESINLLSSAGYTLTKSSVFDLIIEYCLKNGIYNLGEVNNILSEFSERELGPN